jgi:hypothetical protein
MPDLDSSTVRLMWLEELLAQCTDVCELYFDWEGIAEF